MILDSKYQPCEMDWKNVYIILTHVTSYEQQETIAVYQLYQFSDQDYPILITGAKDPYSDAGIFQMYYYADGYVFQLCDKLEGTISYCSTYKMFQIEETGQAFQLVHYNLLEVTPPEDAQFQRVPYYALIDNKLSEDTILSFVRRN
ncbi:MAG: hypothetical protein MSG78_07175 [Clostridiales bacterium]|nr:hypothetical protein [Clostridiales bacterium]